MTTENLLSLDLATEAGWAVSRQDGPPAFGTYRIGRDGCTTQDFYVDAYRWLAGLITLENPWAIVYEAAYIPPTNINTARKLIGLSVVLELVCAHKRVPRLREVSAGEWRKHFLGSAHGKRAALKAACMAECQRRGWKVKDDNQADALGMLDHALVCFGKKRAA